MQSIKKWLMDEKNTISIEEALTKAKKKYKQHRK